MLELVAVWKIPWQSLSEEEAAPVQAQLDREMGFRHPLHGKRARVLGRRVDNDDVVARLEDGTFVNVHLVWSGSMLARLSARYPGWSSYGSPADFVAAMDRDAAEYDAGRNDGA